MRYERSPWRPVAISYLIPRTFSSRPPLDPADAPRIRLPRHPRTKSAPATMNEAPLDSSPPAEGFDRARRWGGLVLAPILFVILLNVEIRGLDLPAQRLLAVLAAVVTLWITEAIPLPVTA